MFEWFFRARDGAKQDIVEMLTVNVEKLALSKFAIEKAAGKIAKAIAKSEFIVQRKEGRVKDHIYYMLNVRTNVNETATDFWMRAIKTLLLEGECLICMVGQGLYIADSFNEDSSVMLPKRYKDVRISSSDSSITLEKTFTSNEVLHLKSKNKKVKMLLEKAMRLYDETISAMCAAKKIASMPKFELNVDGIQVIRTKNDDGTDRNLTINEYKKGVKKLLESDNIEIITNSAGVLTKQMDFKTEVTSEDIVKLSNEVFRETALAFDIPEAVFLGKITEKADSTNEFITYAVSWIVEIINDSMNAKLVGERDFLQGERIWIDMSKYKHIDIIESATNLDKLRSIGFNFDEIREMVGYETLNTEFSQERVITKNYTNNLGGKGKK